MGPSMICWITSGKTRPHSIATIAVSALPINAGNAGRANGASRRRVRTADWRAAATGVGSVIASSDFRDARFGSVRGVAELIDMAGPGYVVGLSGASDYVHPFAPHDRAPTVALPAVGAPS